MPFIFNRSLMQKKQRTKLEEAEQRKKEIFSEHPDLEALHESIQQKQLLLMGSVLKKISEEEKEELQRELKFLKKQYQLLLHEKNIPPNFAEPRWDCPECEDRGEVLTPQGYRLCSCSKIDYVQELQKQSGLPPRFFNASFKAVNFHLYSSQSRGKQPSPRVRAEKVYRAAQEFVKKWSKDNARGLIIDGPAGCGKTYLLACITNGLLEKQIPVKFTAYSDFLYKLKMSFSPESSLSEHHLIEEIVNTPVLIIDDLGAEQATDFSSSILYHIIDRRYGHEKPFVVSTGIPTKELPKKLGYLGIKIIQRILEACNHYRLEGNVRDGLIEGRIQENGQTAEE